MINWRRDTYLALVVIVICVVCLFAWYVYSRSTTSLPVGSSTSEILFQTNPAFATGVQQLRINNATSAIESFQEALEGETGTAIDQETTKYWLAIATGQTGDHVAAIDMLEQVATSSSSTNILRAYAIQQMGLLYYGTLDTSVTAEIFKDPSFATLVVPGDTALTYRHLFEYASSFYPLALSQLYIANWYANQLVAMGPATSTSPLFSNYIGIITTDMAQANTNIASIQSQPTANALVPWALKNEADLLAKLSQISTATSPSDAEVAYKQAIQSYSTLSPQSPNIALAMYAYAAFLAHTYGSSRASDITQLLAPVTSNTSYESYLAQVLGDPSLSGFPYGKSYVVAVANIDPPFKQFLIGLGWSAGDFQ